MIDFDLDLLISFFDHYDLSALCSLFFFLLLLQELFSFGTSYALSIELHDLLEKTLQLADYEVLKHVLSIQLPLKPFLRYIPYINKVPK